MKEIKNFNERERQGYATPGAKLGRPPGSCVSMRILVQDAAFIKAALENGERISALCSRYNVSRSTFTRFMLKTGLRQRTYSRCGSE